MLVTSYQSLKDDDKFVFVPYGTNMKSLKLPSDVDDDYLELEYFRTFEVFINEKRVGLNNLDIFDQIEKQGYALQEYRPTLMERILG